MSRYNLTTITATLNDASDWDIENAVGLLEAAGFEVSVE